MIRALAMIRHLEMYALSEKKGSTKGYRNRKFSAKGIKNSWEQYAFSDNEVKYRNVSFLQYFIKPKSICRI